MKLKYTLLVVITALFTGCGAQEEAPILPEVPDTPIELTCEQQEVRLESDLTQTLQNIQTDSDFTLMISNNSKGSVDVNG